MLCKVSKMSFLFCTSNDLFNFVFSFDEFFILSFILFTLFKVDFVSLIFVVFVKDKFNLFVFGFSYFLCSIFLMLLFSDFNGEFF